MQVDEGGRGRHRIAGGVVQIGGGRQFVEVGGTGHDVELVFDEWVRGGCGGDEGVVGQDELGGHGIVVVQVVMVVHGGGRLVDQLVQGRGVGVRKLGGGD